MPLPLFRRQKSLTPVARGTFRPGLDPVQVLEHPPQALPPAQHRAGLAAGGAQHFDLHAVGPAQADEAQRRRQLLGIEQLGRLAEIHRRAGVDQGVEVQILFFQEQLQEQLVQPREQVPVHEPQIVARHVVAEVGELDALPLAAAAPFALHPPAEDLAADQLQTLQLRQELRD